MRGWNKNTVLSDMANRYLQRPRTQKGALRHCWEGNGGQNSKTWTIQRFYLECWTSMNMRQIWSNQSCQRLPPLPCSAWNVILSWMNLFGWHLICIERGPPAWLQGHQKLWSRMRSRRGFLKEANTYLRNKRRYPFQTGVYFLYTILMSTLERPTKIAFLAKRVAISCQIMDSSAIQIQFRAEYSSQTLKDPVQWRADWFMDNYGISAMKMRCYLTHEDRARLLSSTTPLIMPFGTMDWTGRPQT